MEKPKSITGMTGTYYRRGCKITLDAAKSMEYTYIDVRKEMDESIGETVEYQLFNPDAMFGYDYEDSMEIQKIIDELLDKYGEPEGPVLRITNQIVENSKRSLTKKGTTLNPNGRKRPDTKKKDSKKKKDKKKDQEKYKDVLVKGYKKKKKKHKKNKKLISSAW